MLNDPQARGVVCEIEMQDVATIVADDGEAVEHTERNRWHGEEVHRRNRFPMVSKESEPTFGWVNISRRSFYPTGDCSLGELKTEHEEFPMYPRRSPGCALGSHLEDQLPNLLRRRSSSNLRPHPAHQPPLHPHTCPVPTDYGFRREDDESLFPSCPESTNDDPEELVERTYTPTAMP